MSRLVTLLALVFASLLAAPAAGAQPDPFTIPAATVQAWQAKPLTWRTSGGGTLSATASLHANVSRYDAEERPYSVALTHAEGNRAPVTDDAAYLAEIIGRDIGVDPTRLAFLFRFELGGSRRPLTLRGTFRRSSSGGLVSPQWRVLSQREVEDYTDRHLR